MSKNTTFPYSPVRGGLWVVTVWLALPGFLAAALLPAGLWRAGAVLAWAGASAGLVWLGFGSLTLSQAAGCFALRRGTFFPLEYIFADHWVVEVACLSTPLLRRLGCCVILLRVPGRWYLLPAMPTACWAQLSRVAGR